MIDDFIKEHEKKPHVSLENLYRVIEQHFTDEWYDQRIEQMMENRFKELVKEHEQKFHTEPGMNISRFTDKPTT